ncbi:MAG: hypothetical protein K2Q10_09415, partial [Rhodospirillales bacterium]|nr:hypothetical protein [Rhodospirillales bacterium]
MDPSELAPYLPYVMAMVAAWLLVVVIATLLYGWKHLGAPPARAGVTEAQALGLAEWQRRRRLRLGLRHAMLRLGGLTATPQDPYGVPWLVLVGAEAEDGKSLLDALGYARGTEGALVRSLGMIGHVRFCQEGVVLDTTGGLNGESWKRHWAMLIRTLREARTQRPLDGIVIAVPAPWLTGTDALSTERLTALGVRLHDTLLEAQRLTGLRVPVTVLLTRCQSLPGFAALAAALSPGLRDEELGWPMPYALDTAFQPHWIGEAMGALEQGLSGLQIKVLMTAGHIADPHALVGLPEAVGGLGSGLETLLTAIFGESAYHEAFMFRGFHLTGVVTAPEDGEDNAAFAHRLFAERIFREHGLVRPSLGAFSVRRRRLRAAQAALALTTCLGVAGLAALW